MRSTTLLVLNPRGVVDDAARLRARAALDEGTLTALLGCDVALDHDGSTLALDLRASLVEHGRDVARAARDVAVLLSVEVTAIATIDDTALVVARALPHGTVARALWPPALAARAGDVSLGRAFVDDDERAERLSRALASERLLPEEVLPEIVGALALPLALPFATFAARRRGLVDARVVSLRGERMRRAPTLRGPTRLVADAMRPFSSTLSLSDARAPVSLTLTHDDALVVDVVRLVTSAGEDVAAPRADGVVVFASTSEAKNNARLVIEGVARAPARTTLVVDAGEGARVAVDVVVRAPPTPLFGVDRARSAEIVPFLVARAGGRDVVLATLARDDDGARALTRLLSIARADPALRFWLDGRPVDDDVALDTLVERARAGLRLEARATGGARLARTVVVAVPSARTAGVSETIVVVASGDDGDAPPPFSFDDVCAAAAGGGVWQALVASWTWDAACAPFTTPYEAALDIGEGALAARADAERRLRGIGACHFAAAGPLADALLAQGGEPTTAGVVLVVPTDGRTAAERRLAAHLRT